MSHPRPFSKTRFVPAAPRRRKRRKSSLMTARKLVMRTMVSEIRVKDGGFICPIFRVPKVRVVSSKVGLTGQYSKKSPQVEGLPVVLSKRHAKIRRDGYRR